MSAVKVISGAEARDRFEAGHPVGDRPVGDTSSPVWLHCADGWARTWDEFITNPRWWGDMPTEFCMPRRSRPTLTDAAGSAYRRESFEVGNVSGTRHFVACKETFGDLPEEYRADFGDAEYAVWSYETPIGWMRRDGSLFMPPVRYSLTTTQHQYLLARAWGIPFDTTESARKGKGRTPYTRGWQGAPR